MVITNGNEIVDAYTNGVKVIEIYANGVKVWPTTPSPANNEIYYTSTDGNIVTPNLDSVPFYGKNGTEWVEANIVSNTYSNGLGVIVLDRPVIVINNNAFSYKSKLKSVVIPSTVTILRPYSFYNCPNLTAVTIPSSVTKIMSYAFGLTGLTALTIPSSVTSIGDASLNGDDLRTLIVNNPVPPTLGQSAISASMIIYGGKIKVPAASLSAYKTAAGWSDFASIIVSQ